MPPRTRDLIAQFLRLRAARGHLVPAKLARAIGLTPGALSHVISGRRPFPMNRLDETAAFFGWDAVKLIQRAREDVAAAEATTEEDRRLRILEYQLPVPLEKDAANGNNGET